MKAISLIQPWASLIVLGHKKIETRSWDTKYRGEILIHASATKKGLTLVNEGCNDQLVDHLRDLNLLDYDYPLGAIIGKVTIDHTVKSQFCFEGNEFQVGHFPPIKTWKLTDQELAFGDYTPNRYGWLLSDPEQFENRIPAKGSLSIWNYDFK